MKKEKSVGIGVVLLVILLSIAIVFVFYKSGNYLVNLITNKGDLHLLSSIDNKDLEDGIKKYAKSNGFKIKFTYMGDIEIIEELNANPDEYDAVWLSNSLWTFMLTNSKLTSESKSISISPVVMGVRKSKAKELDLIGKDITNEDILNLIKNKKIKYVMSNVTRTNDGASSYLGFLKTLAGNPVVLTSEMLDDENLKYKLKEFYKGMERTSGSDSYLQEMFLNSKDYDSIIASESSLININKELEANGDNDPLYLLYPTDGVPINDSTLAFIDHHKDETKKENYLSLQKYLRSSEGQNKLEALGRRTWYGGVNSKVDTKYFNKEWGIDTTKYLTGTKFPQRDVITKALNLYLEELRRPSHTVFCLDYSGSMYGKGQRQLVDAMDYILDYEKASKDQNQFSKYDKITVIPFSSSVLNVWKTDNGRNTKEIINQIQSKNPGGGTAIYACANKAIDLLENESSEYNRNVILMTDGESNIGSISDLRRNYTGSKAKIPIYSIMFGSAKEKQLRDIAKLTNAKVFDGRSNLLAAFKEVRGYN